MAGTNYASISVGAPSLVEPDGCRIAPKDEYFETLLIEDLRLRQTIQRDTGSAKGLSYRAGILLAGLALSWTAATSYVDGDWRPSRGSSNRALTAPSDVPSPSAALTFSTPEPGPHLIP